MYYIYIYIYQLAVAGIVHIPGFMHITTITFGSKTGFITLLSKVWPNTHSAVNSEYNVAYLSEAIDRSPSSKKAVVT